MTRFPILAVGGVLAICAGGCSVDDEDDGPDLRISRVSVEPDLPVTGQTFQVSFRAYNGGTRSATACAWRISLGVTTITGSLPSLDDGESFTFSHGFTMTDAGNVTVTATVDHGDVVDETNEGNNTASALVTVGPAGGG